METPREGPDQIPEIRIGSVDLRTLSASVFTRDPCNYEEV